MFFHAGFEWFSGGYVGVDVFFVISGYLITLLIITDKVDGTFSLVQFYERRIRRILPALFLVVLVCVPFAWFWMLPEEWIAFSRSLVSVPIFLSNIQFLREAGYFEVANEFKPLLHTWSIAIEEQYYVGFPIILLFMWRFGRKWLLGTVVSIAIVSIGVAEWGSHNYPNETYYLLPTRAWELMLGATISLVQVFWKIPDRMILGGQIAAIAGLSLIAYAVFSFDANTRFPGGRALIPTVGTALVILFANEKTWVNKFLACKLLVGIGLISYGVYLWHYPLLVFGRLGTLDEPNVYLTTILISGSFVLAYLSWKYVEQPFRDRSKLSRKSIYVLGATTSLLIVGSGLFASSHVKQFPETLAWLDAGIPLHSSNMTGADGEACGSRVPSKACFFQPKNGNPTIAILGDSQARALSESLYAVAVPQGYGLLDLTKGGCPFLLELQLFVSNKPKDGCGPEFQTQRLARLENMDNVVVVIHSALPTYIYGSGVDHERGLRNDNPYHMSKNAGTTVIERESEIRDSFFNTIEKVLALNHNVIIVDPVPTNPWNPVKRLLLIEKYGLSKSYEETIEFMKYPYPVVLERQLSSKKIIEEITNQYQNMVARVDPLPRFCNSQVKNYCTSIGPENIYYTDSDHVSLEGGRLFSNEVIAVIEAWKD